MDFLFPVHDVLAAGRAVFASLHPRRVFNTILGRDIVMGTAVCTRQHDENSCFLRSHSDLFLSDNELLNPFVVVPVRVRADGDKSPYYEPNA